MEIKQQQFLCCEVFETVSERSIIPVLYSLIWNSSYYWRRRRRGDLTWVVGEYRSGRAANYGQLCNWKAVSLGRFNHLLYNNLCLIRGRYIFPSPGPPLHSLANLPSNATSSLSLSLSQRLRVGRCTHRILENFLTCRSAIVEIFGAGPTLIEEGKWRSFQKKRRWLCVRSGGWFPGHVKVLYMLML